ncbi:n19m, NADH-ubiquinone oxidoreductase 9.5 kDa subunit [Coemansia spiralis]|uniref:N19m, NADH-ubiquinone oxidoreductase 9.5 kDa subunit n=1 Tax=Coemansia spiralis TaxID=417178 RepID=A0A9W8KXC8_9FUNG|nr:n19m, NADH-ubiquinone oxidoreductase 9.5 kDa subunit [Coemansia sp. RSA 1358]KAJ2674995.1 n19m, NADH-ubiquinone oxidoreductase 9.5 kDa subunit [Coemansia spiralis]
MISAIRNATFKNPFATWGLALGFGGPLLVLVVPPIRYALGYVPPAPLPESYPLPQRARRPTFGYED